MPIASLTATPEDQRALRQWLWTVHISDGTRALTSASRWQDAYAHLLRHKGIGRRMFDGRQVAVIARATTGDVDGTSALLTGTVPGDPWENVVTACLNVLCRRYIDQDLAMMLDRFRQLAPTPNLEVFHTRLALSGIDAAGGVEHPGAHELATDLINHTTIARDGYAAREVLAHDGCASLLTERQRRSFTELVEACALGSRSLPADLQTDLLAALDTSEAVLTRTEPPRGQPQARIAGRVGWKAE